MSDKDRSEYTTKTPVADATRLLKKVKDAGFDKIIVALSGGKDSICTLALAIEVFGQANVQPYHMWWVKGLRCEMDIIDKLIRRFPQMPALIDLPTPRVRDLLATSFGRSITPSLMDRMESKSLYDHTTVEKVVRFRTGIRWIAGGHRIMDSLHRRGMLHACHGYWDRSEKGTLIQRVYPIYRWHYRDVFAYLKHRKLPVPDMFGAQAHKVSGTSIMDPSFILHCKQHYPDDFAKIKKLYPFVEDTIHRDTIRARLGIANAADLDTSLGKSLDAKGSEDEES